MKNGQKLKLGDAHVTPRHIQEVQASNLGDAQDIPFFINKNIRSCFSTLYFYCFICYVLFLERLCFCFQFSIVQFAVSHCQITPCLFGRETRSVFIAQNTLVSFLLLCECSLFASAAFSIRFCSELFSSSLQLGVFNSLVFVEYCSCELFQKS